MAETRIVSAKVSDSKTIRVQVTPLKAKLGEQEVGFEHVFDFRQVIDGLSGIVAAIDQKLKDIAAKKTIVEFGLEIGVEAGNLTALIAKGSGAANLKITLEWS